MDDRIRHAAVCASVKGIPASKGKMDDKEMGMGERNKQDAPKVRVFFPPFPTTTTSQKVRKVFDEIFRKENANVVEHFPDIDTQ